MLSFFLIIPRLARRAPHSTLIAPISAGAVLRPSLPPPFIRPYLFRPRPCFSHLRRHCQGTLPFFAPSCVFLLLWSFRGFGGTAVAPRDSGPTGGRQSRGLLPRMTLETFPVERPQGHLRRGRVYGTADAEGGRIVPRAQPGFGGAPAASAERPWAVAGLRGRGGADMSLQTRPQEGEGSGGPPPQTRPWDSRGGTSSPWTRPRGWPWGMSSWTTPRRGRRSTARCHGKDHGMAGRIIVATTMGCVVADVAAAGG